jgi:cholesterol oxidase
MAERALAAWPNRGEPDLRPELGAEYRVVKPQLPRRPVIGPAVLGSDAWR